MIHKYAQASPEMKDIFLTSEKNWKIFTIGDFRCSAVGWVSTQQDRANITNAGTNPSLLDWRWWRLLCSQVAN